MKITVYTLATDDDNGTDCQVFTTEYARDDAMLEWVGKTRDDWQSSEHADDICEFVQQHKDYMDTASPDQHEIEIDITVNHAWRVCKDEPGSFGNLYDPTEIMRIMDGWSEESQADDPDSNYFDTNSPEDIQAVTAWCELEGPDFEDQISELVCTNLPTREEAYKALEKKRKDAA